MRLELDNCVVRSLHPDDAPALARHADDRDIWLNLRDGFPHPYTVADAEAFIAAMAQEDPETKFAIEVDGEAAGAIGLTLGQDVERVGAEIGYWLGRELWGRGVITEALRGLTHWAIEAHDLRRVWAVPYAHNEASCRVLEKAGYVREGRMRHSAIKDGRILDQYLYAYVI